MTPVASKTQIDRLGDNLRKGRIGETELRALDAYRRTFGQAYEQVVGTLQTALNLVVSGRPAKSTTSIVEKLRRETKGILPQDMGLLFPTNH